MSHQEQLNQQCRLRQKDSHLDLMEVLAECNLCAKKKWEGQTWLFSKWIHIVIIIHPCYCLIILTSCQLSSGLPVLVMVGFLYTVRVCSNVKPTIPLKSKLPLSRETRLVSLLRHLISLKRHLVSLEWAGSTRAWHSADIRNSFTSGRIVLHIVRCDSRKTSKFCEKQDERW